MTDLLSCNQPTTRIFLGETMEKIYFTKGIQTFIREQVRFVVANFFIVSAARNERARLGVF